MLWKHVAEPRHGVAADGDVNIGELFFDERTERHRGEELLLEHDRDPDHIRPFRFNRRTEDMVKDVPIDVDLGVLYRVQHLGRHEDLVRQVGFHGRHADPRRGIH